MITDFMPVARAAGSRVHDYVHLVASKSIERIIECVEGELNLGITASACSDIPRDGMTRAYDYRT